MLIFNELLHFFVRDLPLCVGLIGYEYEEGIGVSIGFDLVDPIVLDVLEGVPESEVEDEKDCM